jgi:hypothetical protein
LKNCKESEYFKMLLMVVWKPVRCEWNNCICRIISFLLGVSAELCVYLCIELQGDQTSFSVFELLCWVKVASGPKSEPHEFSLHPQICFLLRFILILGSCM